MTTSTKWAIAGVAVFAVVVIAGVTLQKGSEATALVAKGPITVAYVRTGGIPNYPGVLISVGHGGSLPVRSFPFSNISAIEMDPLNTSYVYMLEYTSTQGYRLLRVDANTGTVVNALTYGFFSGAPFLPPQMEATRDGRYLLIAGRDVAVGGGGYSQILHIVDTTTFSVTSGLIAANTSSPNSIGLEVTPNASYAAVSGYDASGAQVMYLFSLTPPTLGTLIGTAPIPGAANSFSFVVSNDKAFFSGNTSLVLRVSIPSLTTATIPIPFTSTNLAIDRFSSQRIAAYSVTRVAVIDVVSESMICSLTSPPLPISRDYEFGRPTNRLFYKFSSAVGQWNVGAADIQSCSSTGISGGVSANTSAMNSLVTYDWAYYVSETRVQAAPQTTNINLVFWNTSTLSPVSRLVHSYTPSGFIPETYMLESSYMTEN